MKKILTTLLVVLTAVFTFAAMDLKVNAAADLIDLYPGGKISNLQGTFDSGNTPSGWVLDFGGYRYHTISYMARFSSNFDDIDTKDEFTGTAEVGAIRNNAMGGIFHNNSNKDVVLAGGPGRDGLTGVVNRMWAYFDKDGNLVMFEDHITKYYMTEVSGTNYYRLSTEAEIKEYEDAPLGEKPENIRLSEMRMVLNPDGETYKAEPLGYLKWTHADYIPASGEDAQVGKPSEILPETVDPTKVQLKDGWTVIHFSTWDRGDKDTTDFIGSLPGHLVSGKEKMELNYLNPAPYFVHLHAKDVNPGEEGINVVYKINEDENIDKLIANVEARHVNEEQQVAKTFTKVNYKMTLKDETGKVLDTIDVVYDDVAEKYTPSKNKFEGFSTSVFGTRYFVEYEATQLTSENETSPITTDKVKEVVILDVGVLPIHFTGVKNVTMNEGLPVDLFDGINAFDNSADLNDITGSLTYEIDGPNGSHINLYDVKVGTYQVTVRASYFYTTVPMDPKVDQNITVGDHTAVVEAKYINSSASPFAWASAPQMYMYTKYNEEVKSNILKDENSKWHTQMILIDAEGKIVAYYNGANKKARVENGEEYDVAAPHTFVNRKAWIDKVDFQQGYKLILGTNADGPGGPGTVLDLPVWTVLKNSNYLDVVKEYDGFATTVVGEQTYTLTVKDIYQPNVKVLVEDYVIYSDNTFKDVQEALTANVQITDSSSYQISLDGDISRLDVNFPTEKTKVVYTVIDADGNRTVVEFYLTIKAPKASESEIEDLEDTIKDLEDTIKNLETELKTNVDSKTTLTMVILFSVIAIVVSLGGSVAIIFLKKS